MNPTAPLPLQLGLPALDLFPRGLWTRDDGAPAAYANAFRSRATAIPAVNRRFRRAIVDYLRLSRSIECRPEQVLGDRVATRRRCASFCATLAPAGPANVDGGSGISAYPAGRERRGGGDRCPVPVDDRRDGYWPGRSGITRARISRC